jgi:hypothetical protein
LLQLQALPFSNLLRYYLDTYKDDIDDLTTTAIDIVGAKFIIIKHLYATGLCLFLTERAGDFAAAVNGQKEISVDIMENAWSIVKVQHDINETANNIDLGMFVDTGKISMNNDTNIQNDWYLKLDGKIDLVGMSQLVQTAESDLDVTSAGSIERDQQGQSNKYNYNYWSSPVSPNTTANNTNYTVKGVLYDGQIQHHQQLIGLMDMMDPLPINLARYWVYKFDNYSNLMQIGYK